MEQKTGLAAFLASNTGRRFFNIFYSWGASIVIIGALFKIIHLPYANEMLIFGMATEALIFFISGFDDAQAGVGENNGDGGEGQQIVQHIQMASVDHSSHFSPEYAEKMSVAADSMDGFAKIMDSLNEVALSLLASYKQITDSSQGVSDNSIGFSQSMKSLNQNVLGLNGVYEAQLNSVKDQIETVQYMNESLERIKRMYDGVITDSSEFKQETEKMTKQIQALNSVYSRLLQAMTANNTPPAI